MDIVLLVISLVICSFLAGHAFGARYTMAWITFLFLTAVWAACLIKVTILV